ASTPLPRSPTPSPPAASSPSSPGPPPSPCAPEPATAGAGLGPRLRRPRREAALHVLDAVDEERHQPLRLADDLEVRQPPEDLAEHHRDLAAREVGAEAVVRSRPAEGDVLV